jgi:hypothetical protein
MLLAPSAKRPRLLRMYLFTAACGREGRVEEFAGSCG